MKKLLTTLFILLSILSFSVDADSADKMRGYGAGDFIGGCTDCLDAVDATKYGDKLFTVGDHATVKIESTNTLYEYVYTDSGCGASESSPDIIYPDSGRPASTCWVLNNIATNNLSVRGNATVTGTSTFTGTATFNGDTDGISLSEIENLTTNKTFSLASYDLEFNYKTPAGHAFSLTQDTGNPVSGTHLLHIQAEDNDVVPLHIYHSGTPTDGYVRIGSTASGTEALLLDANKKLNLPAYTSGSVPYFGASGLLSENNGDFQWDNTNETLQLGYATAEKTIDIDGTSYQSHLRISDTEDVSEASAQFHRHSTTDNFGPNLVTSRSNSTGTAHSTVTDGQNLFTLTATGWNNNDSHYEIGAEYRIDMDGDVDAGDDMPGMHRWLTSTDGTDTPTEKMRLSNAGDLDILTGDVKIGTGTINSTQDGSDLFVAGKGEFDEQLLVGGNVGIGISGGTPSYKLDVAGSVNIKVTDPSALNVEDGSNNSIHSVDSLNNAIKSTNFYSETYNGRHNLIEWDAILAQMTVDGTSNATILALGDSWVEESAAFSDLAKYFYERFGHSGEGWINAIEETAPIENSRWATKTYSDVAHWDSNTLNTEFNGINGSYTIANNASATIDITAVGTDFSIHYIRCNGCGDFQYRIDAGGWQAVDTNNAATDLQVATTALTGLSDASHTIEIDVTSLDSNGVQIAGVKVERSSSGIRLANAGVGGQRAQFNAQVPAADFQTAVTDIDPDLTIIQYGVNDLIGARTKAQFKTDIQTLITNLQAVESDMSILLYTFADTGSFTVAQAKEFSDALVELSAENNVAVLDLLHHIGDYDDRNDADHDLYVNVTHLGPTGKKISTAMLINYLNPYDIYTDNPPTRTNFKFGYENMLQEVGSTYNLLIGQSMLNSATEAKYNVCVSPEKACSSITTAKNSVILGWGSGEDLTTGQNSLFLGTSAGANTTTANNNTFIGTNAGKTNVAGSQNTYIGTGAGDLNTGSFNVFIGKDAGGGVTTNAHDNTFIGYQAGEVFTTGSNNVIIGHNVCQSATCPFGATDSQKLAIDSDDVAAPLIQGDFSANTLTVNGTLSVNAGANVVYRCTSAGTLPVGALTITAGDCGATADTGLRVN